MGFWGTTTLRLKWSSTVRTASTNKTRKQSGTGYSGTTTNSNKYSSLLGNTSSKTAIKNQSLLSTLTKKHIKLTKITIQNNQVKLWNKTPSHINTLNTTHKTSFLKKSKLKATIEINYLFIYHLYLLSPLHYYKFIIKHI